MKQVRIFYSLFVLFFLSLISPSQGQSLSFDQEEHDIGKVEFQDSVTQRFTFTNTGREVVRIQTVESDCGCATVSFPSWSISPQSAGSIKVTYLPYKYGKFHKQFLVHTDQGEEYLLVLKGEIKAPEQRKRVFPYAIGPFRAESKFFSFGKITNQQPVTKRFELYNPLDEKLIMTGKMELPAHLKVFYDTSYIAYPKQVLPVLITYDPRIKNDLGFLQDDIILYRHTEEGMKPISVRVIATVEEYFPPLTEADLAKMPELSLSYNTINLGSVAQHETAITRFILTNKGPQPLKIRKIVTDDGCQVLTSPSEYALIAPGESLSLRVQFKDLGQTGTVSRFLTLMTNDPRHAREMLEIKAYIKEN